MNIRTIINVASEQSERLAEIDRQAANARANQWRIVILQARVAEIRAAATGHEKSSAADLRDARNAVAALDVSEANYYEFAEWAQAEKARTLEVLDKRAAGLATRETKVTVLTQGDVEMAHLVGYMVTGGDDAVCCYIDPIGRAFVEASTESASGCPVVIIARDGADKSTEIEFTDFKGWRFHAGGAGKSIAIALVRKAAVK